MTKKKKSVDGILEKLEQEAGKRLLGVNQAKSDIFALLDGLEIKDAMDDDEIRFNQGVQAARKRLENK